MTDYETFHASCLDTPTIPSGPGDLIVSLRLPLTLQGPSPDQTILLEAGAILLVDANVLRVGETAMTHLCGIVRISELRFAVAQMLDLIDHSAVRLRSQHEPQIDDWIAENTLFSWRTHTGTPCEPEMRQGWFNGMRAAWEATTARPDR